MGSRSRSTPREGTARYCLWAQPDRGLLQELLGRRNRTAITRHAHPLPPVGPTFCLNCMETPLGVYRSIQHEQAVSELAQRSRVSDGLGIRSGRKLVGSEDAPLIDQAKQSYSAWAQPLHLPRGPRASDSLNEGPQPPVD